ncbi:MAG: fructose-bisphosphate aldolase, partial [Thermoprotei archaeon]
GLPDKYSWTAVAYASRVAVEMGADIIKTFYSGEGFEKVVKSVPAPIVILGGPKRGKVSEVLDDVKKAVEAGAKGIAFGRNIFQQENPCKVLKSLEKIIHKY